MDHKMIVDVGGKVQEISPVRQRVGDSMEISFQCEYTAEFFEQMKKELSVVDITDWPAKGIEALCNRLTYIEKLVTRNPKHYQDLQMEEGFACVAGNYDTLFGLPLILDKKGKIKAAQVEVERKGGGSHDDV